MTFHRLQKLYFGKLNSIIPLTIEPMLHVIIYKHFLIGNPTPILPPVQSFNFSTTGRFSFSFKQLSLDARNSKFFKSHLLLSQQNDLLTLCHWLIPQPWQWQLIVVIHNHGSLKKKHQTPHKSLTVKAQTSKIIYAMFSLKKSDLWHPNLHKYVAIFWKWWECSLRLDPLNDQDGLLIIFIPTAHLCFITAQPSLHFSFLYHILHLCFIHPLCTSHQHSSLHNSNKGAQVILYFHQIHIVNFIYCLQTLIKTWCTVIVGYILVAEYHCFNRETTLPNLAFIWKCFLQPIFSAI